MAKSFRLEDDDADRAMVTSTLARYLPRVWIYPLRGHGLPVILLITALLEIGTSSLVAVLMLIVGSSFTAYYAVRVIERTSLGRATPPRLTGDALMLADRLTWSTLVLPALLIALHVDGQTVWVAALLLVLPAHWVILATTRSLLSACNPIHLLHVVWVTGPAYLVVCTLWAGCVLLGQWFAARLPTPVLIAVWLYLLIAACHLLGFLAYLRHERLGHDVQVRRPSAEDDLEAEQTQRLETLVQAIRTLHFARDDAAASRLMLSVLAGPADARRFHEELFERIKAIPARGLALTQAARLISFLLDRKLVDRALDVFASALDLDPRFQVQSAFELVALADRALLGRQRALIGRILDNAQNRFADDPALRLLDRIRIRTLVELDRDEPAARAILQSMGDIEGHPHSADLRMYAQVLGVQTPESPPRD